MYRFGPQMHRFPSTGRNQPKQKKKCKSLKDLNPAITFTIWIQIYQKCSDQLFKKIWRDPKEDRYLVSPIYSSYAQLLLLFNTILSID